MASRAKKVFFNRAVYLCKLGKKMEKEKKEEEEENGVAGRIHIYIYIYAHEFS